MTDIKLGLGKIPLKDMCFWLDQRGYSKDLAINYIKDIYNTVVSDEIKKYSLIFDYSKDIFTYFDEMHPSKKEDDGSREWFDNYGRNRYIKFYNTYIESSGFYDEIICFLQPASVIHHIFPIVYGGKSNPQNLIGINDRLHTLLHKNPLENEEKYCFQAVDFLQHLVTQKHQYIIEKYNIASFQDNERFMTKVYHSAIEEEMNLFYDELLKNEH